MGESYFAFYINEYDNFDNFIEAAVGEFVTNKEYGLQTVDNASGFFKGDVSKNGVEYAVKASHASNMGYVEIIRDYALDIYTSINLESYLNKMREDANNATKNQAFKMVKEEIGSADERLIQAYKKSGRGNLRATFKIS